MTDADATAAITARHLLAHTGGFAGDLFLDTGDGGRYLHSGRAGPGRAAVRLGDA